LLRCETHFLTRGLQANGRTSSPKADQTVIAALSDAVFTATVQDPKRTVVSYVATYLKPEMLHVYRQTTGLQRYENWIVTRRRECRERFPASNVVALRRHPLRWFHRAWHRMRGNRPPLDSAEIRGLSAICASKGARLIHVYFGTEAVRCLPFMQRTELPKIVSFHGADLSQSLSTEELNKIAGCTDLFLCRSKSLAGDLERRGVDKSRIRINYTGVPIPRAQHTAGTLKPLRILQACRFLAKKGLDTTVRAVAALHAKGHELQLTLAGDGAQRESLERLAASLGISGITSFPGFLGEEDLVGLCMEHDLFVHPSRTTQTGDREGIPNSLLEAMACGLPVVATSHSGIPEAITHGKTGWLIGESDPQELAAAIEQLGTSPDLRAALGSSARQEVIDRFSIAACVRTLERAYDELACQSR
jgi:colanic acid/amylovoran biosynthesis glycosyltransferase